jgi:hypothetical protein
MISNELAVVNHDWYISTIVGNTFWLIAVSYYFYNLFLGFTGKYIFELNFDFNLFYFIFFSFKLILLTIY